MERTSEDSDPLVQAASIGHFFNSLGGPGRVNKDAAMCTALSDTLVDGIE